MGNYEDSIYEIHYKISKAGLTPEFEKQLDKMKFQDKHKYKPLKDMWEYAYNKVVKNGKSK